MVVNTGVSLEMYICEYGHFSRNLYDCNYGRFLETYGQKTDAPTSVGTGVEHLIFYAIYRMSKSCEHYAYFPSVFCAFRYIVSCVVVYNILVHGRYLDNDALFHLIQM